MYSIGEFSKITGITLKALRHYHELGLLAPGQVDPESGYRYYTRAKVTDYIKAKRYKAVTPSGRFT